MNAYHVYDKENSGDEAYHEIVFAETASKAKYASEAYSNGVPWTDISVFKFMGFTSIPSDVSEVKDRFRTLAKQMHPDTGGNAEDFKQLQNASEQAMKYFVNP